VRFEGKRSLRKTLARGVGVAATAVFAACGAAPAQAARPNSPAAVRASSTLPLFVNSNQQFGSPFPLPLDWVQERPDWNGVFLSTPVTNAFEQWNAPPDGTPNHCYWVTFPLNSAADTHVRQFVASRGLRSLENGTEFGARDDDGLILAPDRENVGVCFAMRADESASHMMAALDVLPALSALRDGGPILTLPPTRVRYERLADGDTQSVEWTVEDSGVPRILDWLRVHRFVERSGDTYVRDGTTTLIASLNPSASLGRRRFIVEAVRNSPRPPAAASETSESARAPASGDPCDLPREDESFAQFDSRCRGPATPHAGATR
jgi:hypothetical protein